MKRKLLFISFILFGAYSFAQEEIDNDQITFKRGEYLGVSIPLKDCPAADDSGDKEMAKDHQIRENRKRPEAVNANALPTGIDPLLQTNFGTTPLKAPIVNFDGQTGAFPPDPSGAVGPNHYIQAVNSKYRIYNKNGTPVTTSLNLSSLWAGSTNDGDPIVLYDKHADRWVITQFQISGNKILFAVSTTPDPTGTYYTYSFSMPTFPDYPKFSIWADGYYMTSNSSQKNLAVFQRDKMLVGDPTAAFVGINQAYSSHYGFKCILPADADGPLPPYGTPQYFFYFQDDSWAGVSQDVIKILKFQVNWDVPSSSSVSLHQTLYPTPVNSVFTTSWNDIIQKNSSQKLDAISSIFNFRAQYIRWSDYNTVMLCHVADIDNNNTGGLRWYELREDQATGQFSIFQEGTYGPTDGDSRFIGSIAMDMNGSIGMAYSISGPNSYPSLGYTGRFPWQPLGEMWAQETIAVSGISSQSGGNRYGDYSHMSLDPNGNTFWFTGEYIGASGSRRTRIFSFEVQDFVGTPQTQLNESEMVSYVNNGELNVELKNVQFDANVEIELFEMSGRSIRKGNGKIMGGMMKYVFDVNDLPSAAYLVRVSNHDAQRVQKIVIQ